MAKKYNENEGVWRTVGGRRIFIRDGQDLASAMRESGKFKNVKIKEGNPINEMIQKSGINVGGKLREVDEEAKSRFDKIAEKNLDDETTKFILHSYYPESNKDALLDKYKSYIKEKYMNIPQEERVKAYTEGKNWVDLVNEKAKEDSAKKMISRDLQRDFNIESEKADKLSKDHYETIKKMAQPNSMNDKIREEYAQKRDKQTMSSVKKQQNEIDIPGFKDYKYNSNTDTVTVKPEALVKDIENKTNLKIKEAFETDLYGNGKEDRFMLEDGKWISHTTESFGQKDDTWSVNELKNGSVESKKFSSYDDMIKGLNSSDGSTKSFADEVKNYKPKNDKEYHSAKEVLLNRFNRTYNDGDTKKEDYEKRMNNVKVLEESEDYVLYASKDDNGFVNIQTVTSFNPKSKFDRPPEVYFEQDYKGNIKSGSATVNWGAYGSQNPETTKEFIDKLTKAQQFADRINKGKDYSKMWNNTNQKDFSKQTGSENNNAYKRAYDQYKKKHPNSKLNLNQFIEMSEGK